MPQLEALHEIFSNLFICRPGLKFRRVLPTHRLAAAAPIP
jgi:hypothetical protein